MLCDKTTTSHLSLSSLLFAISSNHQRNISNNQWRSNPPDISILVLLEAVLNKMMQLELMMLFTNFVNSATLNINIKPILAFIFNYGL